jgi:hypothetical protein
MTTICSICCETYNKSTRAEILCMYCKFPSCRSCCQTYILGETTAKCMNESCGKEWIRKFITDSFPATFINGPLKKHRENVLFDRERALLPATQPYAEALKQIKNNDNEIMNIFKMINDLNRRRNDLAIRQRLLKENPVHAVEIGEENLNIDNDKQPRRNFIKACPVDECRGFLSSQWKCGLCETWTCPDCNIIIGKSKDAPHTCDPNNIESAKMLKAETKPCPKCAASIFKIDGCDQMWCTQCHTAFSWNTGRIETKIHNPHYYEWLRKTQGSVPRDPLDIPDNDRGYCAEGDVGPRMIRILQTIISNKKRKDDGLSDLYSSKISWMIRNIVHYREVVIRDTNNDYEEKNRKLRISYLMNEITEDMLKTKLQQTEKRYNKKNEEMNVYRLVCDGSSDIIRRFVHYLQTTNGTDNDINYIIIDEIKPLVDYANECLCDISKTYGGKTFVFGYNLEIIYIKKYN